jgi:hypothetical protein
MGAISFEKLTELALAPDGLEAAGVALVAEIALVLAVCAAAVGAAD